VGGVFYEHGHRMIAGTVALLTLLLTGFLHYFESRRWVRRLGYAALAAVIFQAGLGGMTVLLKLPKLVSIAHACLAQGFFTLLCLIAFSTSGYWKTIKEPIQGSGLRVASGILVALFLIQLILGASVRHLKAGLAIPDFPTVFGGVLPPHFTLEIAVHFAHRVGALTLTVFCIIFSMRIYGRYAEHRDLIALSGGLVSLVSFQIMLGAFVIWIRRPIPMTTLHLVIGALCLALSALLCAAIFRHPLTDRERVVNLGLKERYA